MDKSWSLVRIKVCGAERGILWELLLPKDFP